MNEIIKNGLDFLNSTNIQLKTPQFGSFSVHDGKRCVQFCQTDTLSLANIENVQNFKFILLFTLLDYYIDLELLPNRHSSFRQKYLNLDTSSEDKLILQQVYRVAKIIRNCLVHNTSALNFSNNGVSVNYCHMRTNFSLELSSSGLDLFYKIIYLFLSETYGKNEYFLALIRSMYKDLVTKISRLEDDFEENILSLNSENLCIAYTSRDIFSNPNIEINSNTLAIKNVPNNLDNFDIIFDYKSKNFRVPSEALSNEHSIPITELETKWINPNKEEN